MSDQPVHQDQEPEPEGAERRRHTRVDVSLKARFLGPDNAEHPCLVVNISAGGAKLRAKSPPAEGENIVLYIDDIGRFEGKVVRSGKHTFAVDYRGRRSKSARTADALTLTLNQPRENRTDRRIAPRIKQDEPAIITLESGEHVPCSILDISLTGASIEIEPRPPLGSTVIIGKTAAKVVRRHEKGVGVIFSGPAQRMEDAIKDTSSVEVNIRRGADLASHFGRKGS